MFSPEQFKPRLLSFEASERTVGERFSLVIVLLLIFGEFHISQPYMCYSVEFNCNFSHVEQSKLIRDVLKSSLHIMCL